MTTIMATFSPLSKLNFSIRFPNNCFNFYSVSKMITAGLAYSLQISGNILNIFSLFYF